MDLWGDFFFHDVDIYEEDVESVEARKKQMQLMFTDETYLSEVKFLKVLGSGGTATAVLCRHNTTGEFVVDKVSNGEFWDATEAEVHCMTRLAKSKYFLTPRAYFKSSALDHTNHLIMDYFHAKNLDDFLSDRILNMSDVQNILRQLGEAFVYMHSKGVIHLDIKPANILINDSMECKIIDFGHSVPGPEAEGRYGAEIFAAPEVIAHKYQGCAPCFGYSCDYYSLGLTALSIASNLCHLDFLADLLGSLGPKYLPAAAAVQKALNPDGPQDTFYDLVMRLIEKDPAKRLNDKTFLSHPFFRKKFTKQDNCSNRGKLSYAKIMLKVKNFNPYRYIKKIKKTKTATQFEDKIMLNGNAKLLMARRFALILDIIHHDYGVTGVSGESKGTTSFLSKVKWALSLNKEKFDERGEYGERRVPDKRTIFRCFAFLSRKSGKATKKENFYYYIEYND